MTRRTLNPRLLRLEDRLAPAIATWDGGGANNNWMTAANWVGDVAPMPGDDLVFPDGIAQRVTVNDFAAGTQFGRLTVNGLDYQLEGNAIGLGAGFFANLPSGVAPSAGPVVALDLNLTVNSQIEIQAPSFGVTFTGDIQINGGATLQSSGTTSVISGVISGSGGVSALGGFALSGANTYSGETTISGSLELRSGGTLGATGAGNDTTVLAGGTLLLTGAGVSTAEAITLTPSTAMTATISVSPTTTATLSGPITLGGADELPSTFNIAVDSTLTVTSGIGQIGSTRGLDAKTPNGSFRTGGTFVVAASAVNTFTGRLNVSFGLRTRIDGRSDAVLAEVGFGAVLEGSGISGPVDADAGGLVSGGAAGTVGTLTTGNLLIAGAAPTVPSGALLIDADLANGALVADRVSVHGTVSVNNATLLLNVPMGIVPPAGTRVTIIDNDGTDAVVGTFETLPEGAVVQTFGSTSLRITYHGGDGNDVQLVAGPAPLSGRYAVAAGVGGLPIVNIYDGSTLVRSFFAYDQSFRGGVNVATADVTNDGVPDTITAPGFGGGPVVRIWDGRTGAMVRQFNAYDPAFRGGVNISTGLINSDAIPDIITGAGRTGGPHVKAFDTAGNTLVSFLAYDSAFTGGVSVAGGSHLIITGAGPGGGPHVKSFNAQGALLNSFFAYATSYTGGINVAYNSVNGTVLTAPKSGMSPLVKSFSLVGVPAFQFLAYSANFTGGVNLAVLPIGPGGTNSIITGPGPGGGPDVRIWNDNGTTIQREFLAFDPGFIGGVFVG